MALGFVDFTTMYIVRKRKCPVIFIEIKPFVHLGDISTREKADQQMCDRFTSIIGRNELYGISNGISLFRLCLHEGDKHPSTFNCTRSNVCNRCRSCWSMELRFVGGKWGAQDESISRKYQRDVRRNHGVFVNFLYLLAIISVKRLQSGEKIVYS